MEAVEPVRGGVAKGTKNHHSADLDTPTPRRTIQGSRVSAIGRRLHVLVLSGVLVLTPSTLGVQSR